MRGKWSLETILQPLGLLAAPGTGTVSMTLGVELDVAEGVWPLSLLRLGPRQGKHLAAVWRTVELTPFPGPAGRSRPLEGS